MRELPVNRDGAVAEIRGLAVCTVSDGENSGTRVYFSNLGETGGGRNVLYWNLTWSVWVMSLAVRGTTDQTGSLVTFRRPRSFDPDHRRLLIIEHARPHKLRDRAAGATQLTFPGVSFRVLSVEIEP